MRKFGTENLLNIWGGYEPPQFFGDTMNKIYRFERWLDRYNHIMELMRTIIPILTLILQIIIIVNLLN